MIDDLHGSSIVAIQGCTMILIRFSMTKSS
jgi:hypothetical protein